MLDKVTIALPNRLELVFRRRVVREIQEASW